MNQGSHEAYSRGRQPWEVLPCSSSPSNVGDPCSALTASVKDALRLGCSAIGHTIYSGSSARNRQYQYQYQDLRDLILEAKSFGLPTVLWGISIDVGAGL